MPTINKAADQADTMQATLSITVSYQLNGEAPDAILDNLERLARRAIGDGLLTGGSDAEVETHEIHVARCIPEITEEMLSDFMLDRIENGELALEAIPVTLARYGLMRPEDFVNEMDERMTELQGDDDDAEVAPLADTSKPTADQA